MEEGRGNVVLQLDNTCPQGGHDQLVGAENRPAPFKLTQGGQTELVGEEASFVTLLVVLVLIQGQVIAGILVLIGLEIISLSCTNIKETQKLCRNIYYPGFYFFIFFIYDKCSCLILPP